MKKWVFVVMGTVLLLHLSVVGAKAEPAPTGEQSLDWRHGIFYEIFVLSFYDSNGDGDGDLKGITEKLDYLNDGKPETTKDLEVNGLWLMPITKSPSYHKYDVVDYYQVDPQYGTLQDFRDLTDQAHQRGVKVIIDLVLNHTSTQHPWFQSARDDPNSSYRDYYIWADENTDVNEKGPWGQPVWHETDPGSGEYYYALFDSVMPDLNFDNPQVRKEMIDIGTFWLEQGADGFRLDAAKHIYHEQEIDKNVAWWKEFSDAMKAEDPDVYLVSEVWDNLDRVTPYYSALESMFNFDLAGKTLDSIQTGTDQEIASFAQTSHEAFKAVNPEAIDAPFLTNHDQNRTMSVLEGNVEQAKTAASILLTLPGNPFIYYGEEIGMLGEKPDEYIREPFRWYTGKGKGQTTWEEPRYNTGPGTVSVEEQMENPDSLLQHYRDMIRLRQSEAALMKGGIEALDVGNEHITAFKRSHQGENVFVYHNLTAETIRFKAVDAANQKVIYASSPQVTIDKDGIVTLPGNQSVLLKPSD